MTIYQKYSHMSTDQLFDIYTDLGPMGKEMDVDHVEWSIICDEVDRRMPIPFVFIGIEPSFDIDEDTGEMYYFPVEVPLMIHEAINNIKNKHTFRVEYQHGRELEYIPDVFINCYWDEEQKKLISIPRIEEDELPF